MNIAYACKLLDQDEDLITLNAESQVGVPAAPRPPPAPALPQGHPKAAAGTPQSPQGPHDRPARPGP